MKQSSEQLWKCCPVQNNKICLVRILMVIRYSRCTVIIALSSSFCFIFAFFCFCFSLVLFFVCFLFVFLFLCMFFLFMLVLFFICFSNIDRQIAMIEHIKVWILQDMFCLTLNYFPSLEVGYNLMTFHALFSFYCVFTLL